MPTWGSKPKAVTLIARKSADNTPQMSSGLGSPSFSWVRKQHRTLTHGWAGLPQSTGERALCWRRAGGAAPGNTGTLGSCWTGEEPDRSNGRTSIKTNSPVCSIKTFTQTVQQTETRFRVHGKKEVPSFPEGQNRPSAHVNFGTGYKQDKNRHREGDQSKRMASRVHFDSHFRYLFNTL